MIRLAAMTTTSLAQAHRTARRRPGLDVPPRRARAAERPTTRVALDDWQQQAVVDHPGGPLLVLAGPGTGKTTTMVEAIVRRIEVGARPERCSR